MTLYIDFVSSLKITGSLATFTGGTNYAKYIIKALVRSEKCKMAVKILLPNNCKIPDDEGLFSSLDSIKIKSFLEVPYKSGDILYLPQVNGSLLLKLPKIKKTFPFLKIYGTLHDRQHNIFKYDNLNYIFEDGLKKYKFFSYIYFISKKCIFDLCYNHCVKALDKVFTVSNYSMQMLSTQGVDFIKYYTQGNYIQTNVPIKRGNYILFVGGNRGEKNLLRTLVAFKKYKSQQKSSLQFVVTGITDKLKRKISKFIDLSEDIILKPYISSEELSTLYANSRYVAFLSKAEGYGCPIREAMSYGKVVLASRTTSIPEVAGATMHYVNPYSIDSIKEGMVYLGNDINLNRHEMYLSERNDLVEKIAQQDLEIFLDDFFY